MSTEERTCGDVVRRPPSASQGERYQMKPALMVPWSFGHPASKNCGKINSWCLCHLSVVFVVAALANQHMWGKAQPQLNPSLPTCSRAVKFRCDDNKNHSNLLTGLTLNSRLILWSGSHWHFRPSFYISIVHLLSHSQTQLFSPFTSLLKSPGPPSWPTPSVSDVASYLAERIAKNSLQWVCVSITHLWKAIQEAVNNYIFWRVVPGGWGKGILLLSYSFLWLLFYLFIF